MQTATPDRLIPVTQWNQYHPWPSEAGLRHLILNAETNGFNAVVRRCGRRVLLSEQAFFQFINGNGGRDV